MGRENSIQNQKNKIEMPVELKEQEETILNEEVLDKLIKNDEITLPNLVIKSEYRLPEITYKIKGIDKKLFKDCRFIKTLVIENGINLIEEEAFKNCNNLQNIIMPNSINAILKHAFKDCTQLKTITIPNTKCNNFNELPENIQKIGKKAFKNCTSLKEIHIGTNTPNIAKNAFEGIDHIYYKGNAEGSPWGANNHHTEF